MGRSGRGLGRFDAVTLLGIHLLLLPLGLASGAALRVPGSPIGAQAVGVGTDRLALTARPGRQRLAIGPQAGLRRLLRTRLAGRTRLARRARAAR